MVNIPSTNVAYEVYITIYIYIFKIYQSQYSFKACFWWKSIIVFKERHLTIFKTAQIDRVSNKTAIKREKKNKDYNMLHVATSRRTLCGRTVQCNIILYWLGNWCIMYFVFIFKRFNTFQSIYFFFPEAIIYFCVLCKPVANHVLLVNSFLTTYYNALS